MKNVVQITCIEEIEILTHCSLLRKKKKKSYYTLIMF